MCAAGFEPYSDFTCTHVNKEEGKIIIWVDFNKCKRVAFGEVEVKDELLKELYDALEQRASRIEIQKDDYVFIAWLQPIPPTFHTISQVSYITELANKIREVTGNIALFPYIYYFNNESIKKMIESIGPITHHSGELIKKLSDVLDMTKARVYPSLLLLDVPPVIAWFDDKISGKPPLPFTIIEKWHMCDAESILELLKRNPDVHEVFEKKGEEVKQRIKSICDVIPDAPPYLVSYSILFPLQYLSTASIASVKLVLVGTVPPRDIFYYLTLKALAKKELKDNIFYIPTRSIIHDEKQLKDDLENANKQAGLFITIPQLLLFYNIPSNKLEVYRSIHEKYFEKATKKYEEISSKIKEPPEKRLTLINLLINPEYLYKTKDLKQILERILKNKQKNRKIVPTVTIYSSLTKNLTYTVIIIFRTGAGMYRKDFVEIPLSPKKIEKIKIEQIENGIYIVPSEYVPTITMYKVPEPVKDVPSRGFVNDFNGVLTGEVGSEKFWLTNALYACFVRAHRRERKQGVWETPE